jgi:predicted deacylase
MTTKNISLLLIGVAVLVGITIMLFVRPEPIPVLEPEPEVTISSPTSTPAAPAVTQTIIGSSVEKRTIEAYSFGNGEDHLLFVGGMHGGYEWNSIILAYETIDHLKENPSLIPDNITIHIIPNLNPDGLYAATNLEGRFAAVDVPSQNMFATGVGRFNANNVDLNRNFACKWAPESSWRGATVSAGTAAFSEPEAIALRDYVAQVDPKAVVFWHSQANNVYASECENGVLTETLALMSAYATAASYGAVPVFDAYPITGDAEGWLASIGIPAVTVELGSRTSIEWSQNLAGLQSVLRIYGK